MAPTDTKETAASPIASPATRTGAAQPGPWALYDELIAGIPAGIEVTDFCLGVHWCYVEAACGMGIAHIVAGGALRGFEGDPLSCDLRSLAGLAKSWNFIDASLGFAAINAWYSTRECVEKLGGTIDEDMQASGDARNPLYGDGSAYAGKKVTVIGHFPGVSSLAKKSQLTVLERSCTSPIDVPDPACEYILPDQDFVFLTGTTLTNKTAPRLLALSANAQTILVGPSSVPSPVLFAHGVDAIAGSVVADAGPAKMAVKGDSKDLWRTGIKKFYLAAPRA